MKKIALSPNDWDLIKHYLLGGAAVGAGLGGITALGNHLVDLKRDALDENVPKDQNVLRMTLRTPKTEEDPKKMASLLRGPLALAGAIVAGGGSYAAIRALQQYYKRKDMEQQLQAAQHGYLDVLDHESNGTPKQAADAGRKGMGPAEAMWSVPGAATLLMALASGAVANQSLRHVFPDRKPATRLLPKRVVIDRQGEPGETSVDVNPVQDEDAEKVASTFLLEATAELDSRNSDVADLLAAAANGRISEMEKVAHELGSIAMLDTIKGAALQPTHPLHRKLAARLLLDSPALRDITMALAAAEFFEHQPERCKLAHALPVEMQAQLIKFAAGVTRMLWADILPSLVDVTEGASKKASVREIVAATQLQAA